jgi:hypothetical protein
MVIILALVFVVSCSTESKDESTDEGRTSGQESDQDIEQIDPGDGGDVNSEIDIGIISAENIPSISPTGGFTTFPAELEVAVGNISGETVRYDEIQAHFFEEGSFVSGVKCADLEGGTTCLYWYDDPNTIPDFEGSVIPVEIPNMKETHYPISSGVNFVLDDPAEQIIAISVWLDGLMLVQSLFEF